MGSCNANMWCIWWVCSKLPVTSYKILDQYMNTTIKKKNKLVLISFHLNDVGLSLIGPMGSLWPRFFHHSLLLVRFPVRGCILSNMTHWLNGTVKRRSTICPIPNVADGCEDVRGLRSHSEPCEELMMTSWILRPFEYDLQADPQTVWRFPLLSVCLSLSFLSFECQNPRTT